MENPLECFTGVVGEGIAGLNKFGVNPLLLVLWLMVVTEGGACLLFGFLISIPGTVSVGPFFNSYSGNTCSCSFSGSSSVP